MTVNELLQSLRRIPDKQRELPIEVWLPGTRISIDGGPILMNEVILIEGNVKPGSALIVEE